MPAESAHVSSFKCPPPAYLPLDREICGHRVRCLNSAIDPIRVEGKSGRIGIVRRERGVCDCLLWSAAGQCWHNVSPRITRRIVRREDVRRGRLRAGQAERAELAETVNDPLAKMVIVHAQAGTNRGFGIGRVRDGEARSKIQFVRVPVRTASAALAGRTKGEFRLIPQSLSSRNGAICEPLVQVYGGGNLLPMHFIRSLQKGMPQTYRD